jgi:adenosylcobinamide kinase/adenosylcobinamide-phosphate guanylyltransferase
MAKRIIFVTGGCRSGKSRYALEFANRHFSEKCYLATAEPLDEEMARRVENHRKARGPEWQTLEEPVEIVDRIARYGRGTGVILLDCITLWLSNLLLRGDNDERIMDELGRLIETLREGPGSFIIVSNEVGMGIVPADPLSRRFRDLSGTANQRIAREADTVILMASGLPLFLKGRERSDPSVTR